MYNTRGLDDSDIDSIALEALKESNVMFLYVLGRRATLRGYEIAGRPL
jgi:hypothetical protein